MHCYNTCTDPKITLKALTRALTGILGGGVDILGTFTLPDHENLYVLVVMWPEVYAVHDQSAVTTARVLVEKMLCQFGSTTTKS